MACAGAERITGGLEPPPRGALVVAVDGLETSVPASITVTGPAGYSRALGATDTLRQLAPGEYLVAAGDVSSAGHSWSPSSVSQNIPVGSGVMATALISYVITTGALTVAVSGLPEGITAAVLVTGPNGFTQTVTSTRTFIGITPGSYSLSGSAVTGGTAVYAPTLPSGPAVVSAGQTPSEVSVAYVRQTGSVAISLEGLPDSVAGSLSLAGPGGFMAAVTSGGTVPGLDPGTYTLTAAAITSGGHGYAPSPASQQVTVVAGPAPTAASVSYALTTGSLTVTVSGLPFGADAAITVTGPSGFSQTVTATRTFVGIAPGLYAIAAVAVSPAGKTYVVAPASQSSAVTASLTPVVAAVSYSLGTGSLSLTITGLPAGTAAPVTVIGPAGFSRDVPGTRVLAGLPPGSYLVNAGLASAASQTWAPSVASLAVPVSIGATATAAISYAQSTGSLAVTVSGLPGGTAAAVTITGPGGYSQLVTATATLTNLAPGSYGVSAANVTSGGTVYTPSPATQAPSVGAAVTTGASLVYAAVPVATLNLRIDGLYLTQAAQRYDGSTPLVAGRDAYLRVFAVANEVNAATPAVRVRLYSGAALVQTYTLNAAGAGVALTPNEGSLAASWNVLVPAALMQPNLRVLADVDPAGLIVEANETDNAFPVSGTPAAVDVRALPAFAVRFIPVLQQVNSLQGVVSAANTEQFLADLKKMLPVGAYNADVRAPYTTTAAVLQSDNANGAWGTILSEVLALKSADASTRYYYGVVKTTYSSGVAGIGYVGGSARSALGWDRLPSGSGVMAHEVGHNMSRQHAPCGGVSGPDPSYPYAGGQIGIWGLDVATLALKSPTGYLDLMGYCSPNWVSDYNWSAMIGYRQSGANNTAGRPDGLTGGRGLLVWGRITENGPVLEPAFEVDAAVSLPAPGSHRLDAVGVDGSVLFSVPFSATALADLPSGPEEAFAFVLPLDPELAGLRITAAGRTVSLRAGRAEVPPATSLARDAAGRAVLRWDASRYPMVLVRDAATGQVLSFARGGELHLPMAGGRFQLTYSDGVRSRRENSILR